MLTAHFVYKQNDGEVTKAYYERLNAMGPSGELAVALFRAQKRSTAAKSYRSGRYRRSAYDVKSWSLSEISRILLKFEAALKITWGWKEDPKVLFDDRPSQVLYVDLPGIGQCSFHSPTRGDGPDYPREWCGHHTSTENILAYCVRVEAQNA
jgi:hypothetical protein